MNVKKRVLPVVLALTMLVSMITVSLAVNAASDKSMDVPKTNGITLDGAFGETDWSVPQEVANVLESSIKDLDSVQMRTAYDETNLYVGVEVTGTLPAGANSYAELYISPTNYRGKLIQFADVDKDFFQLRLFEKGQNIVFGGEGMGKNGLLDLTDVKAVQTDKADNGGYIIETKIPWSIMGVNPVTDTESLDFGFDVQVFTNNEEAGMLGWAGCKWNDTTDNGTLKFVKESAPSLEDKIKAATFESFIQDDGTLLGGTSMRGFNVSPDGKYVYAGLIQTGDCSVAKINAETGKVLKTYDSGEFFPKGLADDGRSNLYVGFAAPGKAPGKIEVLNAITFDVRATINFTDNPMGINGMTTQKIGDKYYLYVCVNYGPNRIDRYDITKPASPVKDEAFSLTIAGAPINGAGEPNAIAVDTDGTIYLTTKVSSEGSKGNALVKISADGTTMTKTDISEAFGVNLYKDYAMVSTYNKTGSAVYVVNKTDLSAVATIGNMADASNYTGVGVAADRIFIADEGNTRILRSTLIEDPKAPVQIEKTKLVDFTQDISTTWYGDYIPESTSIQKDLTTYAPDGGSAIKGKGAQKLLRPIFNQAMDASGYEGFIFKIKLNDGHTIPQVSMHIDSDFKQNLNNDSYDDAYVLPIDQLDTESRNVQEIRLPFSAFGVEGHTGMIRACIGTLSDNFLAEIINFEFTGVGAGDIDMVVSDIYAYKAASDVPTTTEATTTTTTSADETTTTTEATTTTTATDETTTTTAAVEETTTTTTTAAEETTTTTTAVTEEPSRTITTITTTTTTTTTAAPVPTTTTAVVNPPETTETPETTEEENPTDTSADESETTEAPTNGNTSDDNPSTGAAAPIGLALMAGAAAAVIVISKKRK